VDEPPLLLALRRLVDAGALVYRGDYYAMPGVQPELTVEQRAFFEGAFPPNDQDPFLPVEYTDIRKAISAARLFGCIQAFDALLACGTFVHVGKMLYRDEQIEQIKERLVATLQQEGKITPSRFCEVTGLTRKYAIPLLEWFDVQGVSIRTSDARIGRDSLS
jgi:selenocysteine-specific elongation factor